ncbi:hypothetical protein ACHAXR_003309, partial [Thalassiosira sp. AJA248-18]
SVDKTWTKQIPTKQDAIYPYSPCGNGVDAGIPLNDEPLLPPPSPLTRRTRSTAGRENNISPPIILKRRSLSYDHEGQRGGSSDAAAPLSPAAARGGGLGVNVSALRTIPSRCEMNHNDETSYVENDMEALRRRTLYFTPTRGHSRQNFHRSRAVSSDIVLNISSDCLPRYDDDLASRIANISDGEVVDRHQPLRGDSFSTPERPPFACPAFNRDRANTCPQRRSIFQQQGDEESGQLDDHDSESELLDSTGSIPNLNNISSRATTIGSPETRRHSSSSSARRTSPAIPLLTTTSNIISSLPSLSTPLSARRSSPPTPISSPPLSTPIASIPSSPQANVRVSGRSPTVPSATPIITRQNYLFRINPHVMKAFMILSLYMLLAYTWNTDLQFRYKSMEINYGLSEYWNGGLSSHLGKAEKIGRHVPGKLFNDDGDDEGIAKLINALGDDASSEDSSSEDDISIIQSISMDRKKRRPSLSHARSISDTSHPAYGVNQQRRVSVQKPNSSKWTFSKLAWALVWMGFMLPVVEAGIREVRRQLNFRFWNVRRLRSFRAMPPTRGGNVHNL